MSYKPNADDFIILYHFDKNHDMKYITKTTFDTNIKPIAKVNVDMKGNLVPLVLVNDMYSIEIGYNKLLLDEAMRAYCAANKLKLQI